MKRSYTIRRARPSDIPAMTELLEMLFGLESDFSASPDKQRVGLQMLLDAPSRCCAAVAVVSDGVVGMGTVQTTISTAEGGEAALVEDLFTIPEHRHNGVGSAILHYLAAWASQRGITRMQLLADRNNATALAFYAGLSWLPTQLLCLRNRIDNHPGAPGGGYDH
jgi:GNAT superfamily N-acetyltransferase